MAEALRSLIEAAQGGDRTALNELAGCVDRFVRMFSGSLNQHLRRTCGSTVDFVLEGLGEAFARLKVFKYESDEQFYSWSCSYIRNRIIDAARREGRAKRAGRPVGMGSDVGELESPASTPSTVLSNQEIRETIRDAILERHVEHPLEMEVVVLKIFEGRSWPAIRGELTLSSEKRARTLFARGLDLLRPAVRDRLGATVFKEFLGL